jgi:hypothetical protein
VEQGERVVFVAVLLTEEYLNRCREWGKVRNDFSIKAKHMHERDGHQDRSPAERLSDDVEGVCCEMAVAIALGIPYVFTNNVGQSADVAGFQVRGTRHHNGHLILRPWDHEDEVYILVTGSEGFYRVQGWMTGWDLRTKKYWNHERNAWWAPISDLSPMSEIWYVTRRHYEPV